MRLNLNLNRSAEVVLIKLAMVLVVLGLCSFAFAGTNDRLSMPRSHLGGSLDTPIFLGIYAQAGVAFDYDSGLPGGGAFILFRPGAAADFMNFLYSWNTGVVVQADYLPISEADQYILSGDVVFRKYFQDMRESDSAGSTFFGLGLGATKAQINASTRQKGWSWLAEVGREWTVNQKYCFWVKAQYRHYSEGLIDYSNGTVQLGAGIPLPW